MNTIKNWVLGLTAAMALSVSGYGCSGDDPDLFDSVDAGELGQADQGITHAGVPGGGVGLGLPWWGYDQSGDVYSDFLHRRCRIDANPGDFGLPSQCVYPLSKLRIVCVDPAATFIQPVRDKIDILLPQLFARLNAGHDAAAFTTGVHYQGLQPGQTCNSTNANTIIRSTTYTSSGMSRYVTTGCDAATAPVSGPRGTARACVTNGVYLNAATLSGDHSSAQFLGALERALGHGLVVADGSGTQTVTGALFSWGGGTKNASGNLLPIAGFAGSGMSTQELCLYDSYSALPTNAWSMTTQVCNP